MKMLKLKFKTKMLLCVITSIIIISGSVQYYLNYQASSEVLKAGKETIIAKVEGIRANIESKIKLDRVLVKVLASNKSVIDSADGDCNGDNGKCNEFFKKVVSENDNFEVITVTNKDGVVVASDAAAAVGLNVKERPYFIDAMNGKVHVTGVFRSKASGNELFGVSAPIIDDGEIIGVMFVGNKMSYIYDELVEPVKAGRTGYAFIVNKEGIIIAHPKRELILNKDVVTDDYITKRIVDNGEGEYRYWWEAENGYKIAEIAVADNGWHISLTVPESELLESLSTIHIFSLVGSLVLIVLISLIVSILIGSVAKILGVLNELISSLAVGRVQDDTKYKKIISKAIKRHDEFSEITSAVMSIQKYFVDMTEVVDQIANKNLDVEIESKGAEDKLGLSMKKLISNFNMALSQVKSAVMQVSTGAEEINSASQGLSSGAASQAASIEDISGSVIKMDERTKVNSDNANIANNYTVTANNAAIAGQDKMKSLSLAMNEMSQRASEVQNIIKTIDDIAFQTNLLALNAAVEAARAGVHGKGFAVVAEEVRNLAARSAKAAGETAELIENVVSEISNGNKATEVTVGSLNEIAEGISKTTDIIAEIACAAKEQSEGMQLVSNGLKQIEDVTHNNTESSEQTAELSDRMSKISTELKSLVGEFKLAGMKKQKVVKKKTAIKKKQMPKSEKIQNPDSKEADIVKPEDVIKLDDSEFGKF